MRPKDLAPERTLHETLLALKPSMPPGVDPDVWDDLVVDLALSLRDKPDVFWLPVWVALGLRHGIPEQAIRSLYYWVGDLRQVQPEYGPGWGTVPSWDAILAEAREIIATRGDHKAGEAGGGQLH